MPEAPTLVAGLHQMAMVCEPIQQCRGHFHITKHLPPLGKPQIGGDQHAGTLVQLGQQVKQQRATGLLPVNPTVALPATRQVCL